MPLRKIKHEETRDIGLQHGLGASARELCAYDRFLHDLDRADAEFKPARHALDILCRPAGDVDGNDVIGLAEEQVEGQRVDDAHRRSGFAPHAVSA